MMWIYVPTLTTARLINNLRYEIPLWSQASPEPISVIGYAEQCFMWLFYWCFLYQGYSSCFHKEIQPSIFELFLNSRLVRRT